MLIPTLFSLNQVEQADVIMAEYREGWAARAEKVNICCVLLKCDQETLLRNLMTKSSRAGSSQTTSGSGKCCSHSRTGMRPCFIGE